MAARTSYFLKLLPVAAALIAWMSGSLADVMESSTSDKQIPFQCSKVFPCKKFFTEPYISINSIQATLSSGTCNLSPAKGTLVGDLETYFNGECISKPMIANTIKVKEQTVMDIARESNCATEFRSTTKLTVTYTCVGSQSTKAVVQSTPSQDQSTMPAELTATVIQSIINTIPGALPTLSISTTDGGITSTAAPVTTTSNPLTTSAVYMTNLALTVTPSGLQSTVLQEDSSLGYQTKDVGVTSKETPTAADRSDPRNLGATSSAASSTRMTESSLSSNATAIATSTRMTQSSLSSDVTATATSARITESSPSSDATATPKKYPPAYISSIKTATWLSKTTESQPVNKTSAVLENQDTWWAFFKTEPGVAVIVSTIFLISVGIAGLCLLCSRRSKGDAAQAAAENRAPNGTTGKLADLESARDKFGGRWMPAERAKFTNQYEDVSDLRRASSTPYPAVAARGSLANSTVDGRITSQGAPPKQNGFDAFEGWRRASYLDGAQGATSISGASLDESSNHYAQLVDASDMLRPLAERAGGERRTSLVGNSGGGGGGGRRPSARDFYAFPSQAARDGYIAMASIDEEDAGGPHMRPPADGSKRPPLPPPPTGDVSADPLRRSSQWLPRMSFSGAAGGALNGSGATFPVVLNRRISEMSINTPM